MKNIVITGGCGFIGAALCRRLLSEEGLKIRIIDNFITRNNLNLSDALGRPVEVSKDINPYWSDNLTLHKLDVTDLKNMLSATEGADAIVHLAANTGVAPSVENPMFDCNVNVLGTLNLLECTRLNNIERFVFASSGAPLGEQQPPLSENSVPRPASPYGASKLAGEGYCSAFNGSFGINTIALRFGNVYGPDSQHKSSAVAKFIQQGLAGELVEVYGDGNQSRDFIFINDLVEAIFLSLFVSGNGGEIFQIATSAEVTINELLTKIKKCFQKQGLSFSDIKNKEERVGDVRRNFSDTTKALNKLQWKAETNLEIGLEKTLKFFIEKDRK